MKLYDVEGHDRPLRLSDEHAEVIGATEHVVTHEQPTRNAAKAEWIDYALGQGADASAVEQMTRVELIEHFGS